MQTLSTDDTGRKRHGGKAMAMALKFFVKLFLVSAFAAMGLFIGGFFKFTNSVSEYSTPVDVKHAQGIVVLTGGSARIDKALKLLEAKKGERLLISGVNPGTTKADLANIHGQLDVFECCVDIETAALDTVGNAIETRKWVEANNYKTLIVVTSAYHMSRSLLEFDREMPSISMIPYPVKLESVVRKGWWKNSETLRFMMSEYLKYIGAWLRPMFKPNTINAIRGGMFN